NGARGHQRQEREVDAAAERGHPDQVLTALRARLDADICRIEARDTESRGRGSAAGTSARDFPPSRAAAAMTRNAACSALSVTAGSRRAARRAGQQTARALTAARKT